MNHHVERYIDLFNSRNIRERILISLCFLALVYMVFVFTVLSSLDDRQSRLDQRYSNVSQKLKQSGAEETVLSQALLRNPNIQKKQEIAQLETRLEAVDRELQALSIGLISADKLPQVLAEVLRKRERLNLIGSQTLPAERIKFSVESADTGDVDELELVEESETSDDLGLYKHTVVFRVEARYFDLIAYLRELENSGLRFFWSELEYHVTTYPDAVVQLTAYTLSTDRGIIGE